MNLEEGASTQMFSKAGRFTSEKYIIFQKKDEITNSKIQKPIKKKEEEKKDFKDYPVKQPSKKHKKDDEKN